MVVWSSAEPNFYIWIESLLGGLFLSFNAKQFCTRFLFDKTQIWDRIWTGIFYHIVLGDVVPTSIFVSGGDGGGGGL
jgi:hypothetical protein